MASLPISDCPPQPSLEEVFLQGGTLTDDGAKPHQYPLVGLRGLPLPLGVLENIWEPVCTESGGATDREARPWGSDHPATQDALQQEGLPGQSRPLSSQREHENTGFPFRKGETEQTKALLSLSHPRRFSH